MPTSYTPTIYHDLYQQSVKNPAKFWGDLAQTELGWLKPFTQPFVWSKPEYRWFVDGQLNITHNCLDRHVEAGRGDKIAYWFTNELDQDQSITYRELLQLVNRVANGLRSLGVEKGDRVVIYMPLTIEQIAIMLACARIGAIHSTVYAGFSAEAMAIRIKDAQAKLVCTATWTQKNQKRHDLLSVVRQAVSQCPSVEQVLVMQRPGDVVPLQKNELDFQEAITAQSEQLAPVPVESSTPLFILYTSGTTGTPKGVVHGHGGYGLFTHVTMKYNFQADPATQVHWTAADTGWITGHSYIVYGPLSNGISSLIYEGSPTYPTPARYWELIEKYQVTSFYTAPTIIRMLMREGEQYPAAHDLSSLQILGSVGEPINPAAWEWYAKYIGGSRIPVIDTWWQTETGGHMLVTPPGMKQKPGKAGLPFLGIQPAIVDEDGNQIQKPNVVGQLVIKHPWPGALLTCWHNPDRFTQYWTEFSNNEYFYTGDVAQVDEDGYYMVLGRADDVINVGGVRVSTAEVESALVAHDAVAEAAVIGMAHDVLGETIKAYVLLNPDFTLDEALIKELKQWVRTKINYVATPTEIESVKKLPKTRSGKIMRRVLKARQQGLPVGDTSTLEE